MRIPYRLISAAYLALFAVAGAGVAPATAQTVELKASLFVPPGNVFHRAMVAWADELKLKSKGRLIVKIFPAGQMGPAPRQFDLARTGVADIAVIFTGLTPGRFPLTDLSNVPGLLKGNYASSLALSEIGPKLFASDYPGVKLINIVPIETEIISRSEIKSANDLKGKRIRAAGPVQSDVLKALGAVPTLVQPGDMNDALSKGMVDGLSTAYSGIASWKLADVGKYVAEGDMGSVTFATVMNEKAYEALPPDLRLLIDETSGIASARIFGKLSADDEVEQRAVLVKNGIKINHLTDEESLTAAGKSILDQAIKNAAAKGIDANMVVEKIKAAMAKHAAEK
jgi:TRAP-type C4-dicarboxylate transport system substrate-binding protein